MAQPTLHVSLTGRQSAQLWPAGHCSQRARAQGGGRYQLLGLAPLGGHSQPCCSSSSQTMRVIFSQCFNTSQLANTQGGSPPPSSPPRWQAGPAHCLRCRRLCVTVYLVVSAQLLLSSLQNYDPIKRKPKKRERESLIKGPKAKMERSRHGKQRSPSKHPHFSPAP